MPHPCEVSDRHSLVRAQPDELYKVIGIVGVVGNVLLGELVLAHLAHLICCKQQHEHHGLPEIYEWSHGNAGDYSFASPLVVLLVSKAYVQIMEKIDNLSAMLVTELVVAKWYAWDILEHINSTAVIIP